MRIITCAEAVKQLWAYLDGEVDPREAERISEHLQLCRRCCGEAEFVEELSGFLASHAGDQVPAEIHDRLTTMLEELS